MSAVHLAPSARGAIGAAGLVLVLAAALVATRLASDPLRFPVTQVDVLGTLDYTDRDVLRERLSEELRRGFYGLDIDVVRREVETLPWVASARVSRVWPARLSIDVEEHEPAARWNDDALLSKRLALFHPPQLAPDDVRHAEWSVLFGTLARLSGTDGRHAEVFEDHRRYGRELARFGITVDALEEDGRRSQTLRLSNAVTVRLGYEDRELRLARFADVYARLVAPLEGRAARFDMRYSNGFAVEGPSALKDTSALQGSSTSTGTSALKGTSALTGASALKGTSALSGAGGTAADGATTREPG